MIIVIVTFNLSPAVTETILKENFLASAAIYKDTPGLIRKNYLSDIKNNTGGGVYCFDTLSNAESWFDEKRIKWLTERYSKPEIIFYDNPIIVDNLTGDIIA
tara:strand:+ start:152 stop:457 length:306 start_codon:yes stop_codon:yes gene_type:complete